MIRGLELRLHRSELNAVYHLLSNISISNTDIYVCEEEIIIDDKANYYFPNKVSGNQFLSIINRSNYNNLYTISINTQIYPANATKNDINTYEDFLNSDCEIIFLLYDVDYVEIYVKSEAHLLQFIKNADAIGCPSITIKTDLNDGRTRMSVW